MQLIGRPVTQIPVSMADTVAESDIVAPKQAVCALASFGSRAFAELADVDEVDSELGKLIEGRRR